ncbi:hypothetical protein BaRGS_00022987 [Batillaria attramentaria]|uniref:Heparanase n=1 Tax=Batillaria attramentaria TaxID=370345 RepID=A0ABD0KF92_9CAEN
MTRHAFLLLGLVMHLGYFRVSGGSISEQRSGHAHVGGGASSVSAVQAYVNLTQEVNTIGSHFVGVTLDARLVSENWDTLDFGSQKVLNLAQALAPAYLRLGGTMADCMGYLPSKLEPPREPYWDKCTNYTRNHTGFNMTGITWTEAPLSHKSEWSNRCVFSMAVTQWEAVNHFVENVGFDFIMDLNVLHRYVDDAWYPENTRQLLDFSAANNFRIAGFELGNEYDLFKAKFDYNMPAYRFSRDYISLQIFLGMYPLYASSMILGPETASVKPEYFQEFLVAGGADIVRASTFHHYYFAASGSDVSNFTDVWVMESLRGYLSSALTQSRSVRPTLRSWLSETSSSYDGGTPNISDRFVAGFLWLDKLGLCAEMGIETVIRQAFYGKNYALIDRDLNPNPVAPDCTLLLILGVAIDNINLISRKDYWLTLLFKQLVSGPVFTVNAGQHVRMYAACAVSDRPASGPLVVYYLNPNNASQVLELPQFMGDKLLLYILTPGDSDGLTSKFVALNGKKLEMNGDELPELTPLTTDSSSVVMPAYSFGQKHSMKFKSPFLWSLVSFHLLVTCRHVSVSATPVSEDARKRASSDDAIQVHVNLEQRRNTIGSHFVGVTLDSSQAAANWGNLDFSSRKVQNLARALTPSYLRFGGTRADCMHFASDFGAHDSVSTDKRAAATGTFVDRCVAAPGRHYATFDLSETQWQELNQFIQTVGFDFIYDVNVLQRTPDDAWSPDNTRQLLQFSVAKNYSIVGFELGNEYNLFKRNFNYTMTPAQLAHDYHSLQSLLREFPKYSSSFLLGPEVSSQRGYFTEFLSAGVADILRASTFHQYYFSGKTSVVSNFTDVHVMDSLRHQIRTALTGTHSVNPQLPVWLSETSSSYSGGTPHVSDRFAAGFLWLDKLGVSAEMGLETVLRQSFYGGSYGLIDGNLNPNPDYWLTLLYKRLVRGSVFTVSGRQDVRLYAACANTDNFVSLNGVKVGMHGDNLPHLSPVNRNAGPVVAPPYSFGFVVLPDVRENLCLRPGEIVG